MSLARKAKLKLNSIFKLLVPELGYRARSEPTFIENGVSSHNIAWNGLFLPQCREAATIAALSATMIHSGWLQFNERVYSRRFNAHGLSTIVKASYNSHPQIDFLSFIRSTLNELAGPYHCWLNRVHTDQEGAYLVIALRFLDHYTFEQVKSLKRRFPQLHVVGFSLVHSPADWSQLVKLFMTEYITIPILLSKKQFPEVENGSFCILFNNLKNPVPYTVKDLDLGILDKEIEDMLSQFGGDSTSIPRNRLMSPSWRLDDIAKDPYVSPLRNLVLNHPGCICADDNCNRLFLSDCNHHRIVIFDGDGRILDCIGSSPGLEDGDFGSAKLMRPAASYYDVLEDSLYFVDSENHAIRKADIGGRMVETLYPLSSPNKKMRGIWAWIQNKLGFEKSRGSNEVEKSEDTNSKCLMFPWHLIKSDGDTFYILNRSFQTLWIMDVASAQIIEVVQGSQEISKICGQHVMEKINLLKEMPHDGLRQQSDTTCSLEGLPHAGLLSSITSFQNHVIISDAVGGRIWKMNKYSRAWSNLQLSNFGILGLPYWATSPLERVYADYNGAPGLEIDHLQSFKMLPGRIDIQIFSDIPVDTELVEPLEEACIWRQARGAAIEISEIEDETGSLEKAGVAQQWYDELDNLAFSPPEPETNVKDETVKEHLNLQDHKIHFSCAVNTSPGTSEVIIYAVLHLKLRKDLHSQEGNQEKYAARIGEIMRTGNSTQPERDLCAALLLNSGRDLRDLVFLKPLHVRIKLDCPDHPKAENSRDIILTNSSIEVNISLNK